MTLETLKDIVKEASGLMLTDTFEISQKAGLVNIVTSSDIAVQDFLKQRLAEALPGSGFLCEEEDAHDLKHDYVWVIDPIDGTANYSRGIDQCAISVGLKHGNAIEMGVVYLPRTDEMFYAERGHGAWRNGKQIHVSDRPFADCVMCTALPLYRKQYTDLCSAVIVDFFKQGNDIRRFGAAAPELCYLAMGRIELFFEYCLSPWDFAGASIIVEEAGGCLSNTVGEPLNYTRQSGVLAANSRENLARLQSIVSAHIQNPTF
ncbi:MAG: inositol monophosphatase [Bacteroidales bacterium]|nr:inositol monophosphatase [Bacteroidales bacterium]